MSLYLPVALPPSYYNCGETSENQFHSRGTNGTTSVSTLVPSVSAESESSWFPVSALLLSLAQFTIFLLSPFSPDVLRPFAQEFNQSAEKNLEILGGEREELFQRMNFLLLAKP